MIVAIDGPAGAGKSTVARAVADKLGFVYVDTGALYRAVTLCALEAGIPIGKGDEIARVAESAGVDLEGPRTFVDGRDVSDAIRAPEVTGAVSTVAAHPQVRSVLARLQRSLAGGRDVVMEGRDIGSTIAPDAPVKIFLTASLQERARRRLDQLGLATDDDALTAESRSIERRDRNDESRASSPLVRPAGATVIDSTGKSVDEIVDEIVNLVSAPGRA